MISFRILGGPLAGFCHAIAPIGNSSIGSPLGFDPVADRRAHYPLDSFDLTR